MKSDTVRQRDYDSTGFIEYIKWMQIIQGWLYYTAAYFACLVKSYHRHERLMQGQFLTWGPQADTRWNFINGTIAFVDGTAEESWAFMSY